MRFRVMTLAVLLLAPIGAYAVDEEPPEPEMFTIDARAFEGNTWIAYRFHAPAGAVVLPITFKQMAGGSFGATAEWFLDDQRNVLQEGHGRSRSSAAAGVVVKDAEGETVVDQRLAPGPAAASGSGTYYYPEADGDYFIVSVEAFDGAMSGRFELRATAGVSLLGVTTGVADLLTEEDFDGEMIDVHVAGNRVRRLKGVSTARSIDAALFGRFEGSTGSTTLSYAGPAGGEGGRSEYMFVAREAGDWTFRIDSSPTKDSPSRFDAGRTFLLTADVSLP